MITPTIAKSIARCSRNHEKVTDPIEKHYWYLRLTFWMAKATGQNDFGANRSSRVAEHYMNDQWDRWEREHVR